MRIIARPRIHIGLADTGGVSARAGGGIGFAFDGLTTMVEVTRDTRSIFIEGAEVLDAAAQRDIDALCQRLFDIQTEPFQVRIIRTPHQHIGLGSKTSLALAIAAGVNILFDMKLDANQLQIISRRGGLSGIGIHTFFSGGVVMDGGHLRVERLVPSSRAEAVTPPPCITRFDFPQNWRVALLLDQRDRGLSGDEESRFFRENLPTPKDETFVGITLLYHEVLPALRTAHLAELRVALQKFHRLGFKARELEARSDRTISALQYLQNELHSVAAGMSSTGPLIYVVMDEEDQKAKAVVADLALKYGLAFLGVFNGWNSAFEVIQQTDFVEASL